MEREIAGWTPILQKRFAVRRRNDPCVNKQSHRQKFFS